MVRVLKLELRGITKRFGTLLANDHIDVVVEPGQIHCLLGENGAGKSTLMNVLYGLYEPTEGEILVDGKTVSFRGPGDAMAAGIGMVHQHFMLVPVFTVAENVALGAEPTKAAGFLNLDETRRRPRFIIERVIESAPVDGGHDGESATTQPEQQPTPVTAGAGGRPGDTA